MNILVLCTGNSARSILLEAILNRLGGPLGISAYSAGSHPAGRVHPCSLALLAEKSYSTNRLRSKSWDEFAALDAPIMDAVITVCGSAASETCPMWPGVPVRAHWGVEDPAASAEVDWPTAFAHAYGILWRRAEAFVKLEPTKLDRPALQAALNQIGKIE